MNNYSIPDLSTQPQKICKQCRRLLPIRQFRVNNNYLDGHTSSCRRCMSSLCPDEYDRIEQRRIESEFLANYGLKRCKTCGVVKLLKDFYTDNKRSDKKQPQCSECCKVATRTYTASHREWSRASSRRWRESNPEKARADSVAYHKLHPQVKRDSERRRQAQKKGAVVKETVKRFIVADRDHWICQICGEPIDPKATHKLPDGKHNNPEYLNIDHWIPLSKGGEHSYDNCFASHARCNNHKNNSMPSTPIPALRVA